MKKFLRLIAVIFMVVFSADYSMAEEAAPQPAKITVADELSEVKINGFASMGYTSNLNSPHSRLVQMREFNSRSNEFSIDSAQLVFRKDATEPGSSGFRFDLDFGYTIAPTLLKAESPSVTQPSGGVAIEQAYITHIFKLGNGLKVDFGKFLTEVGSEVLEGVDGWGWNYSHSFTAYYTIPGTHTGLRAAYDFNEAFTLVAGYVNGWDNMQDNNNSKSYLAHAIVRPLKDVDIHLAYIGGPENTDNTKDNRSLIDVMANGSIGDFSVKLEYVAGVEAKGAPNNADAKWTGVNAQFRYAFSDHYALNFRVDQFKDSDGFRTGTKQTLTDVTLTPEFTLSKNLVARVEFRRDMSDKAVFDKKAIPASVKTQDTVAFNAVYHF